MIQCSFWECFVQLSASPQSVLTWFYVLARWALVGERGCSEVLQSFEWKGFSVYFRVNGAGSRAAAGVDVAFSQLLY
jgi:hypothetical protein